MTDYDVEHVDCCVCNATGRIRRMVFWTKPCPVCDGTRQRPILIAKNFSPADRERVLLSARIGSLNMFPAPQPLSSEALFGFRL